MTRWDFGRAVDATAHQELLAATTPASCAASSLSPSPAARGGRASPTAAAAAPELGELDEFDDDEGEGFDDDEFDDLSAELDAEEAAFAAEKGASPGGRARLRAKAAAAARENAPPGDAAAAAVVEMPFELGDVVEALRYSDDVFASGLRRFTTKSNDHILPSSRRSGRPHPEAAARAARARSARGRGRSARRAARRRRGGAALGTRGRAGSQLRAVVFSGFSRVRTQFN